MYHTMSSILFNTSFYLTMCTKGCSEFFFILFRSWVICENQKRSGFYTIVFYIFINNSISKQNKKNAEHHFVDTVKWKTCAKFQQKILNFVAVGARQNFQFFRQIAWFLGNNRALSKFRYQILYNLISII